jgi:AcrR family transcriptional regulator
VEAGLCVWVEPRRRGGDVRRAVPVPLVIIHGAHLQLAARRGDEHLYQYFPNRDAILVALADREAQRIGERMRALIDRHPESKEDPGRVMVRALIRSYAARRGARRQFALVVTMTGRTGGSLLRNEIAEFLGRTWSRSNATGGPTINKVYAYAMVNAILGVLQAAALENSPVLKEPDLEEALCQIIAALHPTGRKRR